MHAKDSTSPFLPEAGSTICCVIELQAWPSLADDSSGRIYFATNEAGKFDGEKFANTLVDCQRALHYRRAMTRLRRVNFRYEVGMPQREETTRLTPL